MKKWRKENWLLVAAGGVFIIGTILLLLKPNPNPESARYLLSTIPQVIGTFFVLTVAIMQAVGGSELMTIADLVKRTEFIAAAFVSFVGIVGPLVVIYFDQFCIGSAICLSFSGGNLLVIGWFVWRIAPVQAKAKALSQLKKEALEKLALGTESEVVPRLESIAEVGMSKKTVIAQPDTTRDACRAIRDIASDPKNHYKGVWRAAAELLIKLNEEIRKGKKFNLSESTTIPYLRETATKPGFKEDFGWSMIRRHLFSCLKEDIEEERVDFKKPYGKGWENSWGVIRNLLRSVKGTERKKQEMWNELQEQTIKIIKEAIRKHQDKYLCPFIGITFNILMEGAVNRGEFAGEAQKENFREILKSSMEDLAEAVKISPKKLIKGREDCMISSDYSITGFGMPERDAAREEVVELKKRLETDKSAS